jgi:protein phosphatase
MKVYVAVRCGIGKEQCEDVVVVGNDIICNGVGEYTLSGGVVCVADGVGGNEGAQIASLFVAEQLSSFDMNSVDEKIIRNRIMGINNGLIQKGNNCGLPDMATTLTGLVYAENQKYLIHIGNTRAYILQGQYLKQLTTDHTVYNRLLKMGMINKATECKKNEITNCLGGNNTALIDSLSITHCQDFNTMLLTSDGIHDYISIDKMEQLLASDVLSVLEKCESILNEAIDAGSTDDVSVVIIINKDL